jgi:hypothetical protein
MMASRFAPLALLIPAVVLAQSASMPAPQGGIPLSQAGMPPSSAMPAPPVNQANAASALKNAKDQAKELKSMLPSNGDVGSSSGSGWGFS